MKSILVVEDDKALAMGIEYALTREGFLVRVVKNVQEGYKSFMEKQYDLILLDVMLPDGSGYELCKKIRESASVPIIFLTALDEEVSVVQGLDMGGDDYITKPFRVKELISRIKAVLRRTEKNLNITRLQSNNITIYPQEAKVTRDGKVLQLTSGEYKLLNFFIANPNQILARDVLVSRLWGIDGEFVDENTLSVYIRRLREKIEANPSKPEHIITVRGFGYKWVDKDVRM